MWGLFLQYTVFEQLKDHLIEGNAVAATVSTQKVVKRSPVVLSAFQAFLVGALSKTVATILTYPAIRFGCNTRLVASLGCEKTSAIAF